MLKYTQLIWSKKQRRPTMSDQLST